MVFVVKKIAEGSYKVEHRFTGHTKAERSSHSQAQSLAHRLNREIERGIRHMRNNFREEES